jgi:hypothetical protein
VLKSQYRFLLPSIVSTINIQPDKDDSNVNLTSVQLYCCYHRQTCLFPLWIIPGEEFLNKHTAFFWIGCDLISNNICILLTFIKLDLMVTKVQRIKMNYYSIGGTTKIRVLFCYTRERL